MTWAMPFEDTYAMQGLYERGGVLLRSRWDAETGAVALELDVLIGGAPFTISAHVWRVDLEVAERGKEPLILALDRALDHRRGELVGSFL